MTAAEAREILLLYRPGTSDGEDPQIIEAMDLARRDPELSKWFAQQQAFQIAMKARFREIPAPEHLKLALLARQKVVHPPVFWRRPVWVAAAAIFAVLLGLAAFVTRPSVPNRFGHYRETMVNAAVRMYGMDLQTNDMMQLRRFVGSHGAPDDYQLTGGLAQLQLKGGGLQRWRGNPVSMVCFDRGGGTMLFLFVMKQSAVKDPPPQSPQKAVVAQVDGLMTASWSKGGDTYVLAGPGEPSFPEKYLAH